MLRSRPIIVDPEVLLDQRQVARLIRMTTKFMEARRVRGGGIPYVKVGRLVRYRKADVDQWLKENRRTSTSDSGPTA
jgi:excisionase family DNA binding protein